MEILNHGEGTKFPLAQVLRERALAHLRAHDTDTIASYETLSQAIGVDVVADQRGRRAVLQAARILLREDRKKVVNLRTVGYRIVRPNEHATCSQHEQKRARRLLKRAVETATYVSLDKLTPQEVAEVLMEQARAGLSLSFQRKMAKRDLPPKDQLSLPSGDKLVEMFKKRAAR